MTKFKPGDFVTLVPGVFETFYVKELIHGDMPRWSAILCEPLAVLDMDKVSYKNKNNYKISYKTISCKDSEPSVADREPGIKKETLVVIPHHDVFINHPKTCAHCSGLITNQSAHCSHVALTLFLLPTSHIVPYPDDILAIQQLGASVVLRRLREYMHSYFLLP